MILVLRVVTVLHESACKFSKPKCDFNQVAAIRLRAKAIDIFARLLFPFRWFYAVPAQDYAFFKVNVNRVAPGAAVDQAPDLEPT